MTYLHELFRHQEWADASHWRAFEGHAAALTDRTLCERVLHIHRAQHAFLWMVSRREGEIVFPKLEDFSGMDAVKSYARQYHAAMAELLRGLGEEQLEETIEVAWFKPSLTISVRHALTQVTMHSHYHRGQNATRFKELGGKPPMTDFIVWVREGKPAPTWE